jgi:hypothetical protein
VEAIAEVGFGLQPLPLFIGSAGLAEAVASRFAEKIKLIGPPSSLDPNFLVNISDLLWS